MMEQVAVIHRVSVIPDIETLVSPSLSIVIDDTCTYFEIYKFMIKIYN